MNAYFLDGNPSSYQAQYGEMCLDFVRKGLPKEQVRTYRVAQGELPSRPEECDLWIITGSPKSCYDPDSWITDLLRFIREIEQTRSKILGFCFGHQAIALALGGRVDKSSLGWGVGVRDFQILENKAWMTPKKEKVALLVSHQDQVTRLPNGAEHLGQSDFCKYEMFCLADRVLAIQAHPEFTPEFARRRYDSRIATIGEHAHHQAVESLKTPFDADIVWQWILVWKKQG